LPAADVVSISAIPVNVHTVIDVINPAKQAAPGVLRCNQAYNAITEVTADVTASMAAKVLCAWIMQANSRQMAAERRLTLRRFDFLDRFLLVNTDEAIIMY